MSCQWSKGGSGVNSFAEWLANGVTAHPLPPSLSGAQLRCIPGTVFIGEKSKRRWAIILPKCINMIWIKSKARGSTESKSKMGKAGLDPLFPLLSFGSRCPVSQKRVPASPLIGRIDQHI